MSNFILVAESGSDIPPALAKQYDIHIVPMHVTMGGSTLDDGTFSAQEVCEYYEYTGSLPKTSGCSPHDFEIVFQALHKKYPQKHILHLAYSAVTTCSYQSASIAAEGADYITSIDTKQVSAAQAAIVLKTAKLLEQNPDWSPEQVKEAVIGLRRRSRMCFLPDDLEYLRAGGRVSNVACLGGRLLGLHPCIEILDGRLTAKKKYRGKLENVVPALIREYSRREHLESARLTLLCSVGLSASVRELAEEEAVRCGFLSLSWLQTGCVITTHAGPGCFGMMGFAEQDGG